MNATAPTALPLLESDVLRTFVAIADSGSFTRTAAQVFRSTAAVSLQIKRLEETLGQRLFIREARQVRLTAEGEVLLGYARRLLKLNEEAVANFLKPALSGRVCLGIPNDLSTRVLPGVLTTFARSHPAVQVDVCVGRSVELVAKVDAGELDLCLLETGNQGLDDGLGEVVHTEPLVWAGRDGGLAVRRSPLPLALANPGCAWRRAALDALDRAGLDYRVSYSCDQSAGQEAAMIADLAIAPFPRGLVRPPLRRLDEDHGLPPLGDYQIKLLRGHQRNDAIEALATQMIQAFAQG
ncbi:LysR substrate-binding domain-containing protein [Ectopseudomonas hydrolytica]|uniref:LysR substrate-binding domain-containing protein n=1 Tax=Ectopseudomonas hydrolytica TaxID=2493633 RepID=UPI0002787FCC|nr:MULTISPECIES: LysR substrate-binding domain-containing protein [Pseudomonas]EJO92988.1 LysR family transcriptional regulator [Pseudomonas mendocina DLHK]UTH30269.1 LysR substrate-binding domain-containing protein [Pseudomonas hydrolytica]UTH35044.1 LysR substrate-binding domain-containing protein [Pseudomonas sp. KHPS1]UZZ09274.1 LysR substrate-binding domain-containing protein [Pseudomonas mendocina]